MDDRFDETPAEDVTRGAAAAICHGTRRLLSEQGFATLPEVSLATGRRVDILAIDRSGSVLVVEVKSSVADFRADRKWQDYLPFCDRFAFAVGADFPRDLIPEQAGLIVADAYQAVILREPMGSPLSSARRKALLVRFAMVAAARLMRADDPPL